MKKRGNVGDVIVTIFVVFLIIFIFLFEFSFIYTELLGHKIKITGFAFGGKGDHGQTLITINADEEVGRVREDFYGANTHGSYLGAGTKVDADANGINEAASDLEWHRKAWLDSGMKYMRWDASLQYYYSYDDWKNLDFENCTNTNVGFFSTAKETGAVGWKVSAYNGGTGFVSQSNDSHSGNFSLNVSCNQSSHVYVYRNVELKEGNNYNFSLWVKGNGTASILIQRLDNYSSCGYKSFNANETWQFVSIECNATNTPSQNYRVAVDGISNGENIIIDDANFTENGENFYSSYILTGDLSNRIEQLKWAHENGIKVLLIMSYMPTWLADTSIEGCNQSKLTDCPPYDYNIWGNITVDYLNRLTGNGFYAEDIDIEVWNEPYGNFWLSNLSYDDITKATEYVKLYNETYNAIKAVYPNIAVGGPSGYRESPIMTSTFLSNLISQIDFFSFHIYNFPNSQNSYNKINSQINNFLENCSLYNVNCSRIIISEFNIDHSNESVLIKNTTSRANEFETNIGLFYASTINNWPQNISMMLYQWSETKKYSPSTNYPEYPHRWSMVSEPQLDNELYSSYNVTKDFAHYHAGGSMIVNSSSSNSSIKVVASRNQSDIWHITVIMTGGGQSNVSIDVSSAAIEALMNLKTGEVYPAVDGIVNIGVLEQYDVKHYESTAAPEIIQEEPVVEENIELINTSNETDKNKTKEDKSKNETETLNEITTTISKSKGTLKKIFRTEDRTPESTYTGRGGTEEITLENGTNITVESGGENQTESLAEVVLEYIIDTSTRNSKRHSSEDSTSTETSEEEVLLNEEIESEVSGSTTTSYSISQALSNKSYLSLVLILLGGIIIVSTIIYIMYKRKKRNAEMIITLKDWINNAKRRNYKYSTMKKMLEEKGWNKSLVERALQEMDIEREGFY